MSARSIRTADDLIYSPTESEVMMNENNDVFTMILSQVEATAVTDDVSFTAVPAKIPKAMLLCDIPRF